jgi:hypothetical protein
MALVVYQRREAGRRGCVYCVCATVKLVFSVYTTIQYRVNMKKGAIPKM